MMAGCKFYGTKEHIVLVYWQAVQSILSVRHHSVMLHREQTLR